jgi:2-oxoglutarate ferredoxin oxidoreductase subunit alpha
MRDALRGPEVHYPDGETLLVGWGSTRGAMLEAAEQLRAEGRSAGVVHFTDLWPFPSQAAVRALEGRRLVMVEQNATGQLGRLLREQTGLKAAGRILKIDGRPFYPAEIVRGVDRSMAP